MRLHAISCHASGTCVACLLSFSWLDQKRQWLCSCCGFSCCFLGNVEQTLVSFSAAWRRAHVAIAGIRLPVSLCPQVIEILHEGVAAIPRAEVQDLLAKMYKVTDKACIVIFGFHTVFGGGKTTGFGLIYDNISAMRRFEPKYRLVRAGLFKKTQTTSKQRKERKNRGMCFARVLPRSALARPHRPHTHRPPQTRRSTAPASGTPRRLPRSKSKRRASRRRRSVAAVRHIRHVKYSTLLLNKHIFEQSRFI